MLKERPYSLRMTRGQVDEHQITYLDPEGGEAPYVIERLDLCRECEPIAIEMRLVTDKGQGFTEDGDTEYDLAKVVHEPLCPTQWERQARNMMREVNRLFPRRIDGHNPVQMVRHYRFDDRYPPAGIDVDDLCSDCSTPDIIAHEVWPGRFVVDALVHDIDCPTGDYGWTPEAAAPSFEEADDEHHARYLARVEHTQSWFTTGDTEDEPKEE